MACRDPSGEDSFGSHAGELQAAGHTCLMLPLPLVLIFGARLLTACRFHQRCKQSGEILHSMWGDDASSLSRAHHCS